MSSTTIAAEAILSESTLLEASASVKLLGTGDQGSCGFAPRWWCLDLSVSGDVLESTGGERPGTPAFDTFPGRAPFILQVEHGVLGPKARQPGLGAPHVRLMDATSGLTYVLASSVTVNLLGPKSLRTYNPDQPGTFDNRGTLFTWLSIVVIGSVLNSLVYISFLYFTGMIPQGQWNVALLRFGIGDIVGIVGSMPLLWMLLSEQGRARLKMTILRWETLGYVTLAIVMLVIVFGHVANVEFMHFYFLFLPIVWAATRQGLYGAGLIAFVLQFGIVVIVNIRRC